MQNQMQHLQDPTMFRRRETDQLQQDSTLGDDNGIDFMRYFNKEATAKPQSDNSSKWLGGSNKLNSFSGVRRRSSSPFSGENPFSN